MTREEAIKVIKEHIDTYIVCHGEEDTVAVSIDNVDVEALDMAIKALEQEHCEDVVSRQAVLEVIRKCHCEEWVKADIGAPIEALLSVMPQPKMGRWIMSDDGLYRPICNNCGAHPWKGYIPTVEEATEAFKYCPHCGRKMQEVK